MVTGHVEIAEFAVALAQVEVQRRVEAGNGTRGSCPGCPFVGHHLGGLQSTQVPNLLIVHVVLDVGHRVGKRATVEGVATLPADVAPHLSEHGSCGFSIAMLVQFYALADSCHGGVWFGHYV